MFETWTFYFLLTPRMFSMLSTTVTLGGMPGISGMVLWHNSSGFKAYTCSGQGAFMVTMCCSFTRRPFKPVIFLGGQCFQCHSKCSACWCVAKGPTKIDNIQGPPVLVYLAPPFSSPLCCRSRRSKLIVTPTYVLADVLDCRQ